ncbi:MAG TPA: crossover junction endodeoxyribonuclease RuvC [Vicinamibacterales bacterium]|jgi:crossover junction endodeoxyribonuclease RuvC
MRIFGIDPGSERTGYGCVETDGRRHRLLACGAITAPASASFAVRLQHIQQGLLRLLAEQQPDCVAVEDIFYARNVRSALRLGHARGVALVAAAAAGVPIAEYSPAEIKRAVVGFGRAEKPQVGQMVKLLLGLDAAPSPHDAADALAVAICHIHSAMGVRAARARAVAGSPRPTASPRLTSWRAYRP